MIISNDRAYVWIFLPGASDPVPAGLIQKKEDKYFFTYGQSYLKRKNSIPIFAHELPLQYGTFEPKWDIASCLRDAAPDAWGRLIHCISASEHFQLSIEESVKIINHLISSILHYWKPVSDEAGLSVSEKNFFRKNQFLNPYIFQELGDYADRITIWSHTNDC